MRSAPSLRLLAALGLAIFPLVGLACPGPNSPTGEGELHKCNEKERKFANNALVAYKAEDLGEASDQIAHTTECSDADVKTVAARIALAQLDWKGAVDALKDVDGSEAASLRARGYWYSDDLQNTAVELAAVLDDPDFKDPWAKPVRELAGMQGAGRHPFELAEGSVSLLEVKMPRDLYPAIEVPVEIDGQSTLAIVVTGVPEVVLDSKARTQAGWVTMRFGSGDKFMEYRDVPAMVQDLTQFTANQTVPVGALIGVNLLRRMNATIDRRADQLVIRKEQPPAPPAYTKIPVTYVRGGAMVVRSTMRRDFEKSAGLWIDNGYAFSVALPDPTWKILGVDVKTLSTFQTLQHGRITDIRFGGLDLGAVEAIAGVSGLEDRLGTLDVDVMGAMGVGFWTAVRMTMADQGRSLWVETDEDTSLVLAPTMPVGPTTNTSPTPTPSSSTAKPATSATPSSSASTKPSTAPPPSAKPSASTSVKPPAAPSSSVKPAASKS